MVPCYYDTTAGSYMNISENQSAGGSVVEPESSPGACRLFLQGCGEEVLVGEPRVASGRQLQAKIEERRYSRSLPY